MGATKSGCGDSNTVNQGPAPRKKLDEASETGAAGNVKERGQDPSPAGRARGETSDADARPPVDMDSARKRAE